MQLTEGMDSETRKTVNNQLHELFKNGIIDKKTLSYILNHPDEPKCKKTLNTLLDLYQDERRKALTLARCSGRSQRVSESERGSDIDAMCEAQVSLNSLPKELFRKIVEEAFAKNVTNDVTTHPVVKIKKEPENEHSNASAECSFESSEHETILSETLNKARQLAIEVEERRKNKAYLKHMKAYNALEAKEQEMKKMLEKIEKELQLELKKLMDSVKLCEDIKQKQANMQQELENLDKEKAKLQQEVLKSVIVDMGIGGEGSGSEEKATKSRKGTKRTASATSLSSLSRCSSVSSSGESIDSTIDTTLAVVAKKKAMIALRKKLASLKQKRKMVAKNVSEKEQLSKEYKSVKSQFQKCAAEFLQMKAEKYLGSSENEDDEESVSIAAESNVDDETRFSDVGNWRANYVSHNFAVSSSGPLQDLAIESTSKRAGSSGNTTPCNEAQEVTSTPKKSKENDKHCKKDSKKHKSKDKKSVDDDSVDETESIASVRKHKSTTKTVKDVRSPSTARSIRSTPEPSTVNPTTENLRRSVEKTATKKVKEKLEKDKPSLSNKSSDKKKAAVAEVEEESDSGSSSSSSSESSSTSDSDDDDVTENEVVHEEKKRKNTKQPLSDREVAPDVLQDERPERKQAEEKRPRDSSKVSTQASSKADNSQILSASYKNAFGHGREYFCGTSGLDIHGGHRWVCDVLLYKEHFYVALKGGFARRFSFCDLKRFEYNSPRKPVRCIWINPNTDQLYTGCDDGYLRTFDINSGSLKNSFYLREPITCLEQGRAILFIGLNDGTVHRLGLLADSIRNNFQVGNGSIVALRLAAVNSEKQRLVVSSYNGLSIRDASDGALLTVISDQKACLINVAPTGPIIFSHFEDRLRVSVINVYDEKHQKITHLTTCPSSLKVFRMLENNLYFGSVCGEIYCYRFDVSQSVPVFVSTYLLPSPSLEITSMFASTEMLCIGTHTGLIYKVTLAKNSPLRCEYRGCDTVLARREDIRNHFKFVHCANARRGDIFSCRWLDCQDIISCNEILHHFTSLHEPGAAL